METMQSKLKPVLNKVQGTVDKTCQSSDRVETKHGMSYLDMKYHLQLAYCKLLSFYMLLKLEGKDVSGHPVIQKLIHVKLLLERLRPLDQKLQYQVEKQVR